MAKFLVLSLDGTMDSQATRPTHIARMQELFGDAYASRVVYEQKKAEGWKTDYCFKSIDDQKHLKPFMVTYYDEGLGAPHIDQHGNIIQWSIKPLQFGVKLKDTLVEMSQAVFAEGITNNVAQAYRFLAKHYNEEDQVYAFGFSRGAYTARLLTTMIRTIGLIDPKKAAYQQKYGSDLSKLNQAIADGFACYKHNVHPDDNAEAKKFKELYCRDGQHLIHFLGLFEPVKGWILECVPKDNKISSVPKHIRMALAIDEERKQFHPTIGIPSIKSSALLAWFPGVHADIGGGYQENNLLSHMALSWMMTEANHCGLPIDKTKLQEKYPINALAPQHNSMYDTVPFSNAMIRWKEISTTMHRSIGTTAAYETIHPSALIRYSREIQAQNKDGQWETHPYCPANLTSAIDHFNNPQTIKKPGLKSLVLFNEEHGYKIPERLPMDPDTLDNAPQKEKPKA